MGIGRIFDISRRSLATYQKALDITAHNVSNSSNPEFSRQKVVLKTDNPEISAGFVWGSGVKLEGALRIRNQLLDAQIRTNNQRYYDSDRRSIILGQVETMFAEPSELGLANLMNNFFNTWNELSVTPNSMGLRQNVIYAADKLSTKIKNIYADLNTLTGDIAKEFQQKMDNINRYLREIQKLNESIYEQKSIGQAANDLMDRRDVILDELSKLVNINVTYDSFETANVSIGGDYAAGRNNYVEFKGSLINDKLVIMPAESSTPSTISSGELYALTEMYSTILPQYESDLNAIVTALMDSVNSAHSSGYSLNVPPETSINFFESYLDGDLKINPDILKDPKKIAVSKDGTAGNGEVAIQIAQLINDPVLNGLSIADNYSMLISRLGNEKSSADQVAQSNQMVLQQLETQKASYSGVSLDEEMANIIKFQRSYDASARLIKVANEMLDTLFNML